MGASRTLSTCLVTIQCWIICLMIDSGSSQIYSLATPQPSGSTAFTSCVFTLEMKGILDSQTGLVDEDNLPSGSLLSSSSSTQCSSIHTGVFDLDILSETLSTRIQLSDTSSELFDVFLPLPHECLGNEYVVATWSPGDEAFIAMFNPNDHTININISLGPQINTGDVLVDNAAVTERDGNIIQVSPRELKYVTSNIESLDGVVISGDDNFGVMAGNTNTQVFGFGIANNFLEMFPPKHFFSDEYVVPFPSRAFHSVLKVISLSEDSPVDVTLTDLFDGSPSTTTTTNTLTELGDTWTHSHTNALHVQATGPVMVVQFNPEASFVDTSSMTLIPPTTKWVWSAVLYPLTSSSSSSDLEEHTVVILIKTNHVTDLAAYNLYDGSDVTSFLVFTEFDQSEYSYAEMTVDATNIVLIQHTNYHTFQVIQYGSSESVNGLYSFPAAWNTSCYQENGSTTSPADSSNVSRSSASITKITNTDNYIYFFVCGIIFVVAMGTIVGVVSLRIKDKCGNSQNNHQVSDTARRKDIELPRVLYVKPFKK